MKLKGSIACLALAFVVATLGLFLLYASPDDYKFENIVVPFLSVSIPLAYIHIVISVCALLIIAAQKGLRSFKLDAIAFLLFLRILFFLLPLLYSGEARESPGMLLVAIAPLIVYLIALNSEITKQGLLVICFSLFGALVGIQLLYTVENINLGSINMIEYAWYVKIPLGSTNVIAGYLTPIVLLAVFGLNCKKAWRVVILFLGCYLLSLTTSNAAWIFLGVGFFVAFLLKLEKKSMKSILTLVTIASAFAAIGMLTFLSPEDLYRLFHERTAVWFELLSRSAEYPIFGHGIGYASHPQAHNILIDSLYQGGVVGLVLYAAAVAMVLKAAFKKRELLPLALFLSALFLFQCEETCYFDYRGDVLFWMMAGFVVLLSQKDKDQEEGTKSLPVGVGRHIIEVDVLRTK